MDERIGMNSNEKLARVATNIETAQHFVLNGENADRIMEREAATKINQKIDDMQKKLEDHEKAIGKYAEKFNEEFDKMEIKAIYNYVLVKPYSQNPFQRIMKTDSGIILDTGGYAPTYKSNETGEYEEEKSMIHVGEVVDAGPECKYVKDGDVIYWTVVSEVPVPFFKQGLVLVNETRALVVINSGLTERFKGSDKKK